MGTGPRGLGTGPHWVRPFSATQVPWAAFLHISPVHACPLHSLYVHPPYHYRVLERHPATPVAAVNILPAFAVFSPFG